ncbi:MAG: hypothetical protein H6Q74_2317 [Firmicutes bacterium]|nr:hypothetical protein [Bacillota bacterium]
MEKKFRVAIHHEDDSGYIEYDQATQKVVVVIENQAKKQAIENFLGKEHILRWPKDTIYDFKEVRFQPTTDLESFKIVLTKLWENTQVLVDWSRPVPC